MQSGVKTGMRQHHLWLFTVLLLGLPAWSADRFEEQWSEHRASLPAGISFEIATTSKQYILGEPIRLTLTVRAEKPGAYGLDHTTQDRIGRVNGLDHFVIDPASQVDDPLRGRIGEAGGMGGPRGPSLELDHTPVTISLPLNDWVRFARPGKYRLYLRSKRLLQRKPTVTHPFDLWVRSTVAVASNILELEVVAPPAGWESQQVAAAIRDLYGSPIGGHAKYQLRIQAIDRLRCIDNPEAVRALFAQIIGEQIEPEIRMGLYGSRHDSLIRKELEQMIADPEQTIGPAHLDLLSAVSIPRRAFALDPFVPLTPQQRISLEKHEKKRQERYGEYLAQLAASLQNRKGTVRAETAFTLVVRGGGGLAAPAWLDGVLRLLTASIPDLPNHLQMDALPLLVGRTPDKDLAQEALALYTQQNATQLPPPVSVAALGVLIELEPEQARQLVVEEIRTRTRHIDWKTLAMLPDEELPELDAEFVRSFTQDEFQDHLIARYATQAIAPELKRIYLARRAGPPSQPQHLHLQRSTCLLPIHLYFLKHDPEFGKTVVRQLLTSQMARPSCQNLENLLAGLDRHAMSPALEQVAVEMLNHPSVPVKIGAAWTLHRFGSPKAQKPLWASLEYFHTWWRGRETELMAPDYSEGRVLESTLLTALTQGNSWMLSKQDFERMQKLCISRQCRESVTGLLRAVQSPIRTRIYLYGPRKQIATQMGHCGTVGETDFLRRLGQFPAGTQFTLDLEPGTQPQPEQRTALEWVRARMLAAGHHVVD